ncbi:hypothetical protein B0H34DRAFT_665545, partial [Crassisporium funariophilum]
CGLPDFKTRGGKTLTGANRLYTIIMTESIHLIWLVFKGLVGSDETKIPLDKEITKQWENIINTRLKLDCLMTNKYQYGAKALKPLKVINTTWWDVLHNKQKLPEHWLHSNNGVLVGRGNLRHPGRNR